MFLNYYSDHYITNYAQNYDPKDAEKVETFENEFNASMDYLSNLSAKHSTPKLNSTLKTHVPVSENVHLELPIYWVHSLVKTAFFNVKNSITMLWQHSRSVFY